MKKYSFLFTAVLAVFSMIFVSCSQGDEITQSAVEKKGGVYTYNLHMNGGVSAFDGLATRATTNWENGSKVYLLFSNNVTGTATYNGSDWTLTTTKSLSSTSSASCTGVYVENPKSTSSTSITLDPTSAAYKGTGTYSSSSSDIYVNITLTPMTARLRFKGTSANATITLPGSLNDFKYISTITLSTLNAAFAQSDVSLTVDKTYYTPYIYGTLTNSSGNNTLCLTNNSESKSYELTTFAGTKLTTGTSGYLTIPTSSNYSSLGWSQKTYSDLTVTPNQLTVLSVGAACDFTCGKDVNKFYAGFFSTSKISGMSDDELKSHVKTNGILFTSEQLDFIGSNASFSANTSITLLAYGVASDGATTGTLYKKTFTTGSSTNQPMVTLSNCNANVSNSSLKWSCTVKKNTYCSKYYLAAYTDAGYGEDNQCFVAWCIDSWIKDGSTTADTEDTTWSWDRESTESEFELFARGATSANVLSNVVTYASAKSSSSAKARYSATKRVMHNIATSNDEVKNVRVKCVLK